MNKQPGKEHDVPALDAGHQLNAQQPEGTATGEGKPSSSSDSTQSRRGVFTGTLMERTDEFKVRGGSGDSRDNIVESPTRDKKVFPQVPNYLILEELGRGGMGVVFLAKQHGLNRRVALKMILNHDLVGEETRARFNTEAEVIASLEHPGIVKVFEYNTFQEVPYFALEYFPGGNLEKRIAGKPFPGKEAAQLVRQLADAVQAAHDQGILHRDLKPANVLLTNKNEPKITDFGLAKHRNSGMTGAGQLIGTPSYMPPEQARGEVDKINTLSDIYSLGAILYELCTGRPPFRGDSTAATLQQVISREVVPVRKLNPEIARDLETICLKSLSKEPKKRYASAKELSQDLSRYLNEEPILARPVSLVEKAWKWSAKRPALAASLLASTLLLIALFVIAVVDNFRLFNERERANDQKKNAERSASIARQQEAEANEERGEKEKALEQVRVKFREYAGISVSNGDFAESALWFANAAAASKLNTVDRSRNQDRFSLFHSQSIRPVRARNMRQRARSISYHPNARDVLLTMPTSCFCWKLDTDELMNLSKPADPANSCCYSPSGKYQAVGFRSGTVEITDLTAKKVISQIQVSGSVNCLQFNALEELLAIGANDGRLWSISRNAFVPGSMSQGSAVLAIQFNLNSTLISIAFANEMACVYSNAEGNLSVMLGPIPHVQPWDRVDYLPPCFVADDTKVMACSTFYNMGWWSLDKKSIEDSVQLHNPITGYHLSNDGKSLLYNGGRNTFLVNSESGKLVKGLLSDEYQSTDTAFSHDGSLVFVASSQQELHILAFPEMSPSAHPLVHSGRIDLVKVSADDRFILTSERGGIIRVWSRPKPLDVFHHTTWPGVGENHLFSPSNDGTYYVASGNDVPMKDCKVYSSQTSEPVSPTLHIGQTPLNGAWSSDNSKLVVYSAEFSATSLRTIEASSVHLFSWREGKRLLPPISISFLPLDVVFTPDDKHLVALGQEGQIEVLSTEDGKRVAQATHQSPKLPMQPFFPMRKIRFLPASSSFITFGPGEVVCLWEDINHLKKPKRIFEQLTNSLCFDDQISPNGRWLATAGNETTVRVWDIATGECLARLTHNDWVFSTRFSQDGATILTGSRDRFARLWDWKAKKQICPAMKHQGEITGVAISDNGRLFATGSRDGTIRVWDHLTGKPMTSPMRYFSNPGEVRPGWGVQLAFHHNDAEIIAGVRCKEICNFRITPDSHENAVTDPADMVRLAEVATSQVIQESGGIVLLTNPEWLERWKAVSANEKLNPAWEAIEKDKVNWHKRHASFAKHELRQEATLFHLNEILKSDPNDRWAWEQKGALAWKRQDKETTETCFTKAQQLKGDLADLWLIAMQTTSDSGLAQFAMEKAIAASPPRDIRARTLQLPINARKQQWKAVAEDLRFIHDASPKNPATDFQLALVSLHQGDKQTYLKLRNSLLESWMSREQADIPAETILLLWLDDASSEKNLDRLVKVLERSAEENKAWCRPHHLMAPLLYRMGKYNESAAHLDVAMKLCSTGGRSSDFIFKAMLEHKASRPQEARNWLKKAEDSIVQEERSSTYSWKDVLMNTILIQQLRQSLAP